MILRESLKEVPWNDMTQLNDEQTEELIQDMITSLNENPRVNANWTITGNTVVTCARQRLNGEDLPIFFVCTIRKCLQAKDD